MWTRSELKERGKAAFKANYWRCVLVALLLTFVAGGCSSGSGFRSGFNNGFKGASNGHSVEETTEEGIFDESEAESDLDEDAGTVDPEERIQELFSDFGDTKDQAAKMMAVIALIIIFTIVFLIFFAIGMAINAFLFNPIKLGCDRFFLSNLDEPAQLSDLSYGFDKNYKNVVKILFFRDLYLFLWFLIPVAGWVISIVKGYEYRMIPYLLAEDPDMDKDEAFARSREMMDGQKWNAFKLDWSFIGWYLLGLLTLGVLELLYVAPYVYSTKAALYETLRQGYTYGDRIESSEVVDTI